MEQTVPIIGDESFKSAFVEHPITGSETKSITVNERGEILGDTSEIPDDILSQLQSPEAQAQIRKLYGAQQKGNIKTGRREIRNAMQPRFLDQLDWMKQEQALAAQRQAGLTRRQRREFQRVVRKQMQKQQRSAA